MKNRDNWTDSFLFWVPIWILSLALGFIVASLLQ